jgi:phage major head subunit gpT-like protein
MDLTPSNLQIFFTGLNTSYEQGYEMPAPWWQEVAMEVSSDTELETYGWMDRVPKMRQWFGPRTVNNAPLRSRSITNLDWELTESIPRNKFLDDKLGMYSPIAKNMGWQAKKLHDQQLATLIQAGTTTLGFDGINFFSASHLTNIDDPASALQSNLLTLALTPSNYSAARAKVRSWNGRDGQPLGSRASLLVVPPSLEEAALNILNGDMIAPALFGGQTQVGGQTNILKGSAKLLVIDELESEPTAWYLLDNTGLIKPFVVQNRQAPNFVYLNSPTDPNVFWAKQFIFGVDSRSAYDVSLWFKALRSKP